MANVKERINKINIKSVITHGGTFHADDVFSIALCAILSEHEIEIHRVSKVPDYISDDCIVLDIGGGEFDHHQELQYRDNGIPYASFGLLVRKFKDHFLTDKEYEIFDRVLVCPIDQQDNGGEPNPLSMLISASNPLWNADENLNDQFRSAFFNAQGVIMRFLEWIYSQTEAESLAINSPRKYGVVWLDKFAPIASHLANDDSVLWMGSPSIREEGQYNVQALRNSNGENKTLFSPKYRNRPDTSKGMTFCHASGFMATFESKEKAEAFMAMNYCTHKDLEKVSENEYRCTNCGQIFVDLF